MPFETANEVVAWPVGAIASARLAAPRADRAARRSSSRRAAIDACGGLGTGPGGGVVRQPITPEDPARGEPRRWTPSSAVDGALWIAVLATKSTDLDALRAGRAHRRRAGIGAGRPAQHRRRSRRGRAVRMDGRRRLSRPGALAPSSDRSSGRSPPPAIDGGIPRYRDRGPSRRHDARAHAARHRPPASFPTTATDARRPRSGRSNTSPAPGASPRARGRGGRRQGPLLASRGAPEQPAALGRVLWVGVNATEVEQVRTAPRRVPRHRHRRRRPDDSTLVHQPVLEETARLEVEESLRWVPWTEVDGFDASREDDRHYVLDPEAGDGHGSATAFAAARRRSASAFGVREYRYGGGPEGNVGPKAITQVTGDLSARSSPRIRSRPRVVSHVRSRSRLRSSASPASCGVTTAPSPAADFRELALATPGADIGRAECLPRFHPPTRFPNAAGVVSVVVWPREDRKRPNAPMPDRSTLNRVCALARRAPSRHHRALRDAADLPAGGGRGRSPRQAGLRHRGACAAGSSWCCGSTSRRCRRTGRKANGWPLGRRVHGPELEAAALQVEGVEYLEGLDVAAWDPAANRWVRSGGQPIRLEPWEVAQLDAISVVEGPPLPAGESLEPPEPAATPVPVPTLVEVC